MEKPKQPRIFKRHRGRGFGVRKERVETRETKQNFWKKHVRTYKEGHEGIAARNRHKKARAKAKRSKRARKRNRV